MGSLSKSAGESKLKQYRDLLEAVQSAVRRNFADMDFENADKREDMEERAEEIKRECQNVLNMIGQVTFE